MSDSQPSLIQQAVASAAQVGPPELQGSDEGPRLQAALDVLRPRLGEVPEADRPAVAQVLWRAGFYEEAQQLGGALELGRIAVATGRPGFLLGQMAKVRSMEDRLALLDLHRRWGRGLAEAAARRPLDPVEPPPRAPETVRIGFLSSDLRHHVVGYFAQPVFEFIPVGFELYVYSSYVGPRDPVMPWFEQQATAYRQLPPDDRDAAAMIAADGLDLLIDLGGVTPANRPGVLAFRPAPLQASWLGYPHSLGIPGIDHFIVDPRAAPSQDGLVDEPLLKLERSWICMAPAAFGDAPPLNPTPPCDARGVITFGSANDPYKYTPQVLAAWAQVLARTPGSRFLFVRPEAGAPAFRDNMARHFAAEGVSADRLDFAPVRGGVRGLYARMDIALDTFPVTGGTTTCEALWMGVPTITLEGPGLSERLSGAILRHAGLDRLVAGNVQDFVVGAAALAANRAGLRTLRQNIRRHIRSLPFGDPMAFAQDFYVAVADAIALSRSVAH